MNLVGERQVPDQATGPSLAQMIGSNATTSRPTTPTPSSGTTTPPSNQAQAFQAEYQHRAAWRAGIIGAFNALTVILAVRLTLLLSVGGAFALAYLALPAADPWKLAVLGVYTVVVVVPLVALAARQ
jgi:hypothetical protein